MGEGDTARTVTLRLDPFVGGFGGGVGGRHWLVAKRPDALMLS